MVRRVEPAAPNVPPLGRGRADITSAHVPPTKRMSHFFSALPFNAGLRPSGASWPQGAPSTDVANWTPTSRENKHGRAASIPAALSFRGQRSYSSTILARRARSGPGIGDHAEGCVCAVPQARPRTLT
jgi:hypothetical protein